MPNSFNRRGFLSLFTVSALFVISSGSALAGFEFVPPGGAAKAPAVDRTMTPDPSGVQLAPLEPVAAQPLNAPPVAPVVPQAPAPAQTLQVPVAKQMPAPAPVQQQHIPKVKTVTPSAPLAPPTQVNWNPPPARAPQTPTPAPVRAETVLAPAPAALTVPTHEPSPRVSRRLVINPFPQDPSLHAQPDTAPVQAIEAQPLNPPPVAMMEPPAPAGEMEPVVGFGSDLPLALALSQIAPADYTFSFGTNVNPGAKISWDGNGKPWDQVISEALAPHGLQANIRGKVVHISGGNTPATTSYERRSDATPAITEEQPVEKLVATTLRRANVVDPGEDAQLQPLSTPENNNEAPPIALLPDEQAVQPATRSMVIVQDNILAGTVPGVRGTWEVQQGDSLKETLVEWSKNANINLVWNATHDYTVNAHIRVSDTFESAVKTVVAQGVTNDKPVISLEGDTLTVQDQS